jgi:EAL domain-containing protein (putative c-di-GMP-specific phosphodiesterase class I)
MLMNIDINMIPIPVMVLQKVQENWIIKAVNAQFLSYEKFEEESLIGNNFNTLFHRAEEVGLVSCMQSVISTAKDISFEAWSGSLMSKVDENTLLFSYLMEKRPYSFRDLVDPIDDNLNVYLKKAIANREFFIEYQPQIDTNSGEVIGMEALIRWRHPHLGVITPDQFIEEAQKSGLIIEIGNWVLQSACIQIKEWYEEGFDPGKMSINLGAKHLEDASLVPYVSDTLYRTGCKASWLEFEVSEGFVDATNRQAVQNLNALDDLGVDFSIDDFGTASTSLNLLKQLPISALKIDTSVVHGIDSGEGEILDAILAVGESMGMDVIAEGVETASQQSYLNDKGYKVMQGYHFSKAIEADEIRKMLKRKENILK